MLGTEEMAMSKAGMTLPFWSLAGRIQLSYTEKLEAKEFYSNKNKQLL